MSTTQTNPDAIRHIWMIFDWHKYKHSPGEHVIAVRVHHTQIQEYTEQNGNGNLGQVLQDEGYAHAHTCSSR